MGLIFIILLVILIEIFFLRIISKKFNLSIYDKIILVFLTTTCALISLTYIIVSGWERGRYPEYKEEYIYKIDTTFNPQTDSLNQIQTNR